MIEHDTASTQGWYLFFHRALEVPCTYDNWYLTREEAEGEAEEWGVTPDSWRPLDPAHAS